MVEFDNVDMIMMKLHKRTNHIIYFGSILLMNLDMFSLYFVIY